MEAKINIAEILKDKPQGTKLYDLLYNIDVELDTIVTTDTETVVWCTNETDNNTTCHRGYSEFGTVRGCPDGLQILLPSKEMRDWSKFAWKKGDVLVSNDYGTEVIFYDWYDDTYTNFYGKHYLNSEDKNSIKYNDAFLCTTGRYSLEDKDAAQTYINTIEERLGGKLNRETLEIEKQPEFKDGDILYAEKDKSHTDAIFILETVKEKRGYYACLVLHPYMVYKDSCGDIGNKTLRYATEAEKQQILLALENEGKAWDAVKKQIVDLKPKVELKPFDKVLVRDGKDEIWEPAFFFRNRPELNVYKYQTVGGKLRVYCIPYNEETAKLIGTSDDWRG